MPFTGTHKDQLPGREKKKLPPWQSILTTRATALKIFIFDCVCRFPSKQFCLTETDIGPAFPTYDDMVGKADSQKFPGFFYSFRKLDILLTWQDTS